MNRSSKFNFFLPQNTDPIEVGDFNSNFETIDANLLTKAQSLTEAQKAAVRENVGLNVANNLTTTEEGSVLDARQGKALKDRFIYKDGSYSFSSQAELNSLMNTLATAQEQYQEAKYKLSCTGSFGLFSNGYVYCAEIVRGASTNYINVEMSPIDDATIIIVGDKNGGTWKWGQLEASKDANTLGTIVYGTNNNQTVSVPTATSTVVNEITLPKGKWVIVAAIDWAPNTNGYRQLAVNSTALNPGRNTAVTTPAIQETKETYQQLTYFFSASNSGQLTFYGRQTSGSTIDALPYVWAIKVGN